jgi:hypothetical protein
VYRYTILLAAVLALLAAPSVANAGEAHQQDNRVIFFADPGETNHVTVTVDSTGITLRDTGAPVTPGEGCVAVDPNKVFCAKTPEPKGHQSVTLVLKDRDDYGRLVGYYPGSFLEGDEGADTLIGGSADDSIYGDDDSVVGPEGDDVLRGNSGPDHLQGGRGTDVIDGGGGIDVSDYRDHLDAVTVDLDGVADDGSPGENDDLRNIENVWGGLGDDTIVGDDGDNQLWGKDGADVINGGPGDDSISGLEGPDRLDGGRGADHVRGGPHLDTVLGGPGDDLVVGGGKADVLDGGPGDDRMDGGPDNDTLRARDGDRDVILGGTGQDRARIDRGLDSARGIQAFL